MLILASWIEAPSDFVREYQIRARRVLDVGGTLTGEDWITFGRTDQTTWEIRDVKPGRWEVAVKSLSVIGVSSPCVMGASESRADLLRREPSARPARALQGKTCSLSCS